MDEFKLNLQQQGFHIFKKVIPEGLLKGLRGDIDSAIELDKKIGISKGSYSYMAHNRGESLLELLQLSPLQIYIDEILSDTCILHSYNTISLLPDAAGMIQNRVHRDSPRFCRPYLLLVQILYMIDDFTARNGATYVLPKSHLKEERPTDEEFYRGAVQVEGSAGDAVVFDSLLWHAGGTNKTASPRRALTMGFMRSFMKQQIDYTKATRPEVFSRLNDKSKRLLGYNVRVPENIDQFLLPESERLYKPNQG